MYLLVKLHRARWQVFKQELAAFMPSKGEGGQAVLLLQISHGLSFHLVIGAQLPSGVIVAHLINEDSLRGGPS